MSQDGKMIYEDLKSKVNIYIVYTIYTIQNKSC